MAHMYVHTHTHTHFLLRCVAGGYVLCKELRRGEVGVSHSPFTLRLIAPGLCNELTVTDKKEVCVCALVCEKDSNGKRNERGKTEFMLQPLHISPSF